MPSWMLRNLKMRRGGRVFLTSQRDVRVQDSRHYLHPVVQTQRHDLPSDTLYLQMPKGEFVRFQPHTSNFIDLAAALGPRVRVVWHTTLTSYGVA